MNEHILFISGGMGRRSRASFWSCYGRTTTRLADQSCQDNRHLQHSSHFSILRVRAIFDSRDNALVQAERGRQFLWNMPPEELDLSRNRINSFHLLPACSRCLWEQMSAVGFWGYGYETFPETSGSFGLQLPVKSSSSSYHLHIRTGELQFQNAGSGERAHSSYIKRVTASAQVWLSRLLHIHVAYTICTANIISIHTRQYLVLYNLRINMKHRWGIPQVIFCSTNDEQGFTGSRHPL